MAEPGKSERQPKRRKRNQWGSKLGFVMAASGSAIGLGNIVFFGSNAYRFGGGAFYVPYMVALFALGIPMMIVEFAMGKAWRRALPGALHHAGGKKAEFFAWFALLNAVIIAMYYITILSWAGSMMLESFGPLFESGADSVGPTFVSVLSSWMPAALGIVLWVLNVVCLSRGTATIERVVKIFVPLMWVFMLILVVRGLTLDHGGQGILYLFTPNFAGIKSPSVWQGAFAQMFFSLSLGLGTMTAYASYLPKNADVVNDATMVSFMNCSFELIAGVAIFTILFAFTLHPGASTGTLGMSLVVIPSGIASFPAAQAAFAFFFFFLILIAGLTSSISIIEGPVSALCDKFAWSRARALATVCIPGVAGSILFALPMVLQKGGNDVQAAGISLLELFDHWAFGYSLLVVGLVEAVVIGHVYGIDRLRAKINEHTRLRLPAAFDVVIKWIVPALIGLVLLFNILGELGISIRVLGIEGTGFFEGSGPFDGLEWMPMACFLVWLVGTVGGAMWLTHAARCEQPMAATDVGIGGGDGGVAS